MTEQEHTPEEIAEIATQRTLSDAEKIKGGARYETNKDTGEPSMVFTPEQIEEAREEMGDALRGELEVDADNSRYIMTKVLANFHLTVDEATLDMLEAKIKARGGDSELKNPAGFAYVVASNFAKDQYRRKEAAERKHLKDTARLAQDVIDKKQAEFEQREFTVARDEYWETVRAYLASRPKLKTGEAMAEALFQRVFEAERDEPSADTPERNLRDQHVSRMRARLCNDPQTSPLLKKVLWEPRYLRYAR